MEDPIIPKPALHAQSALLDQLAYEACAALDAGRASGKTTVERYRDAGEALAKARDQLSHGLWLPWLKKHGISKSDAYRCLEVAKVPRSGNFDDYLQALGRKGEESEIPKPVTASQKRCERCDTEGPVKGCLSCMVLNRPADWEFCSRECRIGPPKKCEACIKLNKEKREPGQDAKPKPPKSGKVKFEWKPIEKFTGGFIRAVDEFGKAYGGKESDELEDLRQRASDLRDDFRAIYERRTKQKPPADEPIDEAKS